MARGIRISTALLVAAVVIAGCAWPRTRYDTANSGHDPFDEGLTAANVGHLVPVFRAQTGLAEVPQVVVGWGHLFASGQHSPVAAFDAAGVDGCNSASPRICGPQWTFGEGRAQIVGTTIFTESRYDPTTGPDAGYDAIGLEGCSGAPKTCAPVLRDSPERLVLENTVPVDGLRFRWRFASSGQSTNGYLDGYDVNGVRGCGPPSMPGCTVLWERSVGAVTAGGAVGGPAVGAGLVFTTVSDPGGGRLAAWGPTLPGNAVWTASLGGNNMFTPALDPVVDDHTVFAAAVDNGHTRWLAFDAAGHTGCSGSPLVCTPLWSTTSSAGPEADVAVANGLLYRSVGGSVEVYDARGSKGCSGVPKVCAPLWRAPSGGTVASAPTVAGSLLYVGGNTGKVRAYDAAGVAQSTGAPRQCAPLWDTQLPAAAGSPVIVNGMVYAPTGDGKVTAFRVPA